MADRNNETAVREPGRLARREATPGSASPFGMLERFADEIDSIFDDFGLGRSGSFPSWRRSRGNALSGSMRESWSPAIEIAQHDNELIIRADLPGTKKDDVTVDCTENEITISGERRQEHEGESGGVYRREQTYGAFRRSIALPEGVMTDQATASFKDGVLEIRMPAPPRQVTRGRRVEIEERRTDK